MLYIWDLCNIVNQPYLIKKKKCGSRHGQMISTIFRQCVWPWPLSREESLSDFLHLLLPAIPSNLPGAAARDQSFNQPNPGENLVRWRPSALPHRETSGLGTTPETLLVWSRTWVFKTSKVISLCIWESELLNNRKKSRVWSPFFHSQQSS